LPHIFYYTCIRQGTPNVSVCTAETFGVGRERIVGYLSWVKRSGVYRRRWLGALLVASIIIYSLYANAGADAGDTPAFYTVEYGDTLWKVATEHFPPSEDPRATIETIRRENDLEGYGLTPGMRLELPR
jgi:hypothetical protein